MLFLQPAQLADKCFLHEVLYWLAFARIPVAAFNLDGEVRDDPETLEYEAQSPEGEYLDEGECSFAGIPVDPRYVALLDENSATLPDDHYVSLLRYDDLPEEDIAKIKKDRVAAEVHREECKRWDVYFDRAVEYPKSQIFVALKGGNLSAQGRRLPRVSLEESLELLRDVDGYFHSLPLVAIPKEFWSLQGMDFTNSAASDSANHYCHIQFRTKDVLNCFPGNREPVGNVERISSHCYVVIDGAHRTSVPRSRGRPGYAWEALHLEAAAMIQRADMPAKKEAAIEYFQDFLEKRHGFKPSRASVGEKLKPYYDRFIRLDRK